MEVTSARGSRPSGRAARLAWLLACAAVAGLKFWLVAADEVVARASSHDQQRYVEMAWALLQGHWFGPYDHLTLIREPAYPAWLALVHGSGIPLRLSAEGLLVAASLLFAVSLLRAALPRGLALASFAVLVLQPHSFLVNREVLAAGFYLPLLLGVLSGLIWSARAEHSRGRLAHAAWAGLGAGVLWCTRPERFLVALPLAAFLAAELLARRRRAASWALALRQVGGMTGLVAAGIAAVHASFAGINYQHYSVFRTSDLSGPAFLAANRALLAIEHANPRRYVAVPRDARARAYAVSPTFRSLEPVLESRSWAHDVSCTMVRVCDDLAAGWFLWRLREAAAQTAAMGSAQQGEAFFRRIADELADAAARGELALRSPRPLVLHPWLHPDPQTYLAHLPSSLGRVVARIATAGDAVDRDPPRDRPSTPDAIRRRFDEVAHRRAELTSNGAAAIEGWATAEGGAIREIALVLGGDAVQPEAQRPADGERRGGRSRRVPFRFEFEKPVRSLRSLEPVLAIRRKSGRETRIPLPEHGASTRRDGVRVAIAQLRESEVEDAAQRAVRGWLWTAHAWLVRASTLVGALAALALLRRRPRVRPVGPVAAILAFLAVAVVGRVAMLALLDASSFSARSSRYVYPIVSLYSCGLLLLIQRALRARTSRG